MKKLGTVIISIILASSTVFSSMAISQKDYPPLNRGVITGDKPYSGGYSSYSKTEKEYDIDFSNFTNFTKAYNIVMVDRNNAEYKDEKLYCKKGKIFSIASNQCLGDDYGLEKAFVKMDVLMTGGEITLSVRNNLMKAKETDAGLLFKFDSKNITIKDTTSGISAKIPIDLGSNQRHIELLDNRDQIHFTVDGETMATVKYSNTGILLILNKNNEVVGQTDKSELNPAGYWSLSVNKLEGYIKKIVFNVVEIDQSIGDREQRKIDYTYWVATDDLNRVTIENEMPKPREDRYVGVFYFLCMTGAGIHVQDHTKDYLLKGLADFKKFVEKSGGESYWAEPYFGYYRNTDEWVYRKHAYMLSAANVDFIYLDISNAEVFTEGHTLLFDTWLKIRKEGGQTPQICFLTGDDPKTFNSDLSKLRKSVYSDKNYAKYEELFFKWQGKPLIFGNSANLSADNAKFLENFSVRGCWAWQDKNGYWNWLDEYSNKNGKMELKEGRDLNGNFEQLAVVMGHHPSMSKGRSYVKGVQPNNNKQDFEFSSDTARYGLGFADLFEYAIKKDPKVILITGWNEWIAGKPTGADLNHFANTDVKGYTYVDQFNPEFSRDGEPMKIRDGVGFGDNFYYQMVKYINKYKGIDSMKSAEGQKTIDIKKGLDEWANVSPEYRDTLGDTKYRNEPSYDEQYRYINNTGRNDFDYAKVSQDKEYLYFLITTENELIKSDTNSWMNLYIDTDMKKDTGWEGYDFVVNRNRSDNTVSIEKFKDKSWQSEKVADADFVTGDKYMIVKLSKKDLELSGTANVDFKWSDNSTETGDVMQFMDLGDVAPNDRFNFRYVGNINTLTDKNNNMTLILSIAGGVLALGGIITGVIFIRKKLVVKINATKKK